VQSGEDAKGETKMSNEIARLDPVSALQKFFNARTKQLQAALPAYLRDRPDRYIRLATTALIQNPKIQDCNMVSIINSLWISAQLGLEPNTPLGHGWLIPYGKVCTFQPGYRGLLDLGFRAGTFKAASPVVVYAGDVFEYEEGLDVKLIHRPVPPSQRKKRAGGEGPEDWDWIGAYCRVKLPDGTPDVHWMWREEIEAVKRKASRAGDDSPWGKWFWEMVKKTPVKRHMKFLRLSPEAGMAVGVDDQAEAFTVRPGQQTAQEVVIEADFVEEAESIDDSLRGSHEKQDAVVAEKLAAKPVTVPVEPMPLTEAQMREQTAQADAAPKRAPLNIGRRQ